MNNLTIGGFVMRSLEEIKNDIEKTREQLRSLYNEERDAVTQEVNIDKKKLYKFHDADDPDIKYMGKVYDYFISEGEYIFNVTGVQHCFSEYRDSCWSGFDAKFVICVRPEKLDSFLKDFEELTEEEYAKNIFNWQIETVTQLNHWLNLNIEEND